MKSNNWWEFYFVRYFVGSIVGGIIMLSILFHPDSGLSTIFLKTYNFNKLDINSIGFEHLTIVLTLGLSFCYIASSPILVFHTFRSKIDYSKNNNNKKLIKIGLAQIGTLLDFIATCIFLYFILIYFFNWSFLTSILMLGYILIVWVQVRIVFFNLRKGLKGLFKYYKKLTKERAKQSKAKEEYIESYKHLREHGNAFLILFCEMILGMALFSASSINDVVLILLFWIIPVLPVWLIGTYLEFNLEKIDQK